MLCAKGDQHDLGVEGADLGVVRRQLRHMVTAGESGQVAQEDKQGMTAVSPIIRQRYFLPFEGLQCRLGGRLPFC